jgi:glucose/arabinose dehydrogenase
MKLAIALCLVTIGCGDNRKAPKKDDASVGSKPPAKDAAVDVVVDSPPLLACTPVSGTTMSVRKIGQVAGGATLATSPPNDGRLFVVEQQGRIRIFENEQLVAAPFLDITSKVTAGGEQGLLGLAFHPGYAWNGYFYVYYTKGTCTATDPCFDVVERYSASATDYDAADPASGQIVLSIPDYARNHNGGMIEFGPDGYLYIGTGDGGAEGDPCRNAQAVDRTAPTCTCTIIPTANGKCEPLLGKMLRIDVDHPTNGKPYAVPAGNPFAAGGGEPEIFMTGLRNPWRWSFDRATGDMWIADVGQNSFEEVNVLQAGHQAGANLGWSMYEGNNRYQMNYPPDPTGKTFPQLVRSHGGDNWHAIIGGQVYRGPCYPDITGYYFFSDHTKATLTRAALAGNALTAIDLPAPATGWPSPPASIHADARGELYEVTTAGVVYHLEAGPP